MGAIKWLAAVFLSGLVLSGPASASLSLCYDNKTYKSHARAMSAYRNHDYRAAYVYFLPLAQSGNAFAQNQLGVMYNRGRGVPQDYIEAIHWWQAAAEQGHAIAQCNLGIMYSYGQGVKQDEVPAHMWFNLAAARGLKEAFKRRDSLETWRMSRGQVLEAQHLAADWEAHH